MARSGPFNADDQAIVRKALASKIGAVVGAAARAVHRASAAGFEADLVDAFRRMLEDGAKRDAHCRAKKVVLKTLIGTDFDAETLLRRGLTYTQFEPAWGRSVDMAAGLRADCAQALVDLHVPDVCARLVDLLADPEQDARLGAVRAMVQSGRIELRHPLRLKARLGDPLPEVTGLCFEGVLALDEEEGVEFVVGFFDAADPALVDQALLALGHSRRADAVDAIAGWLNREPPPADPSVAFAALVAHRSDRAMTRLLEVVKAGREAYAVEALVALAPMAFDPRTTQRVTEAVADRSEPAVRAAFAERFE